VSRGAGQCFLQYVDASATRRSCGLFEKPIKLTAAKEEVEDAV
jgi:hypothetical protein